GRALVSPAARPGRRRVARGAGAPGAPRAAAALLPHLSHARRSALSRSATRSVAAPARIDLLLRSRSRRRELRRGPRAHDERARLALDVVGPAIEGGARAYDAGNRGADAGRLRDGRPRHLSDRMPAQLRPERRAREAMGGARVGRPLPVPGRARGREISAPAGSGGGRDHPAVVARALARLACTVEPA